MEWFNLSASYDWKKYKDLMVDYTVVYEDVPNINRIITRQIDHDTINIVNHDDNHNDNSKKED
jgi:hypothetical protein